MFIQPLCIAQFWIQDQLQIHNARLPIVTLPIPAIFLETSPTLPGRIHAYSLQTRLDGCAPETNRPVFVQSSVDLGHEVEAVDEYVVHLLWAHNA